MVAVVVILLLALPVLGGMLGSRLFHAPGALAGAGIGLLAAIAVVALPVWLLVSARKRRAARPPPPPPDVPWA